MQFLHIQSQESFECHQVQANTIRQYMGQNKRHDDRLRVGDSALASGRSASCKGEGVVADNLNVGKSG